MAAVDPDVTYDVEVWSQWADGADVWRATSLAGWEDPEALREQFETFREQGYYSKVRARIVKVSKVVVSDEEWDE
jgi:hypothetical protein